MGLKLNEETEKFPVRESSVVDEGGMQNGGSDGNNPGLEIRIGIRVADIKFGTFFHGIGLRYIL